MTEIAVTANIKDAINKALDLPTCDKSFRQVLESCSGADSITVTTLQSLSKLLRDQLHDGNLETCPCCCKNTLGQNKTDQSCTDTHRYWLHELLKGTTLYRPPTSRPPRVSDSDISNIFERAMNGNSLYSTHRIQNCKHAWIRLLQTTRTKSMRRWSNQLLYLSKIKLLSAYLMMRCRKFAAI